MEATLSKADYKLLKKGDNAMKFGLEMFKIGAKNAKLKTQNDTMAIMFTVLREEFGFGKKRLDKVLERFNAKTDSLAYRPNKEDGITAETLKEILKDETGFSFFVQSNPQQSLQGVQS